MSPHFRRVRIVQWRGGGEIGVTAHLCVLKAKMNRRTVPGLGSHLLLRICHTSHLSNTLKSRKADRKRHLSRGLVPGSASRCHCSTVALGCTPDTTATPVRPSLLFTITRSTKSLPSSGALLQRAFPTTGSSGAPVIGSVCRQIGETEGASGVCKTQGSNPFTCNCAAKRDLESMFLHPSEASGTDRTAAWQWLQATHNPNHT